MSGIRTRRNSAKRYEGEAAPFRLQFGIGTAETLRTGSGPRLRSGLGVGSPSQTHDNTLFSLFPFPEPSPISSPRPPFLILTAPYFSLYISLSLGFPLRLQKGSNFLFFSSRRRSQIVWLASLRLFRCVDLFSPLS